RQCRPSNSNRVPAPANRLGIAKPIRAALIDLAAGPRVAIEGVRNEGKMPIRLGPIQFINDVGEGILAERGRPLQELDRNMANLMRSEPQKHSGREHYDQSRNHQLSRPRAKPTPEP